MHTIAFIFKKKKGMSLAEFHYHYAVIHGAFGAALPGLVEYTHYPVRPVSDADAHMHDEATQGFEGLSIYSFFDEEHAKAAWNSVQNKALQEDTLRFIDLESMITLPLVKRTVL
ncbi:EthD domain-containing protein [Gallaecimonas mangrovi]|uniref:EthD domain-containing protein n=1 Tax=Gallaecimonas mangrovi TaxID=2291597 RepID=UPI000E1FFC27|nr:EthD domain-containing protein [Gallaecimonas mangrovi]